MNTKIPHGYTLDAPHEIHAWAISTFEDYTTEISFGKTEVIEYTADDGKQYRKAFQIVVAPQSGKRWFRIWLFKGATEADLKMARWVIDQAKDGNFDLEAWTFVAADDRDIDRYVFGVSVRRQEGGWWPFGYELELRRCEDTNCTAQFHSYLESEPTDSCTLEEIVHPDGYYVVHGSRSPGETRWNAWVDASDLPDGRAGIKATRDLLNDYEWMQGTCDRLNERIEVLR